MNDNSELWLAIASVLNHNPSEKEMRIVNQWLLEDERNERILKHLSEIRAGEYEEAALAKERVFRNIQSAITTKTHKRIVHIWKYMAVASIALLIGLSGLFWMKMQYKDIPQIETKCPNGITSKITLSDGTTVNLNAGSTLSYPAYFDGNHRAVILDGEAYFDVAKDVAHPFIVKTGEINIKVLGTQFNIRSYKNERETVTTLLEGSVSINRNNPKGKEEQILILQPDQQASYDRDNNSILIKSVDADLYASWRERQYYFENEMFIDIVKKLERTFDVVITIKSPGLETQKFSGIFTKGEDIYQILDLFKKHRNFDYIKDGNKIDIFDY